MWQNNCRRWSVTPKPLQLIQSHICISVLVFCELQYFFGDLVITRMSYYFRQHCCISDFIFWQIRSKIHSFTAIYIKFLQIAPLYSTISLTLREILCVYMFVCSFVLGVITAAWRHPCMYIIRRRAMMTYARSYREYVIYSVLKNNRKHIFYNTVNFQYM